MSRSSPTNSSMNLRFFPGFSSMKPFGRFTRMYSTTVAAGEARGSEAPLRFPAVDQGWHGKLAP
eukprot:9692153-Alexandrium_andersonii.AAC.1